MSPPRGQKTNTTTYFFREREGLELIAREVLAPSAIEHRVSRVWSAGCGTGEEPYSIAIMARELNVPVQIIGTDINEEALESARSGRYLERRLRHVSPSQKARWFATHEKYYRVRQSIRSLVEFHVSDVASSSVPLLQAGGAFDAVLCRNVLIYLTQEGIEAALRAMIDALAQGGLLILGAAEGALPPVQSYLLASREVELDPHRGVFCARRPAGGSGRRTRQVAEAIVSSLPDFPRTGDLPADFREALRAKRAARDPAPTGPAAEANSKSRALLVEGDRQLERGETEAALERYRAAVATEPLVAEAHFRVGFAASMLRDDQGAEVALRRCLFLEPAFWPASFLLAEILTPQHPDEGRLLLERTRQTLLEKGAAHLDPDFVEAFTMGESATFELVSRRLERF